MVTRINVLPIHNQEVDEKNSFICRCFKERFDSFSKFWMENPTSMLVMFIICILFLAIIISSNNYEDGSA
tara:strand:- start:1821 stop:2030 length:210 start_codon:yes stop_codon:yes gene_type:complete